MLAQKITDHVQQCLDQMMQQYKDQPNFAALMTALVNQIQDLEDAIFALDSGRQLWDGQEFPAIGAQLDVIGEIVGISRNGLSDPEYLLFIFGKIAQNFSDSTVPAILSVLNYVFQAQSVLLQEIYPAGISVQVLGTALNPIYYQTAINLVKQSLGAGINLVFVGGSPSVNVFRFDGPGVVGSVNGWGDKDDPTVGGKFVGLLA